jgi:hypothetical protein
LNSRSRRNIAALTSAASLAVGLLGVTASGAQAVPVNNTGQIGLFGGSTGIELINADGTGARAVPNIPNAGSTPNWAPDGSRVVVGSGRQTVSGRINPVTSVVTAPAPTGTRSTTAPAQDPVYFQSGQAVVASTGGQLTYGPSDGSWGPEPLLTAAQEPSTVCDIHPTASADGGVLAFERLNANCTISMGIWTYDSSTGQVQQIIASGSAPVFSADGSQLVFTRTVNGASQLFTAGADGGDITQVTDDPDNNTDPTWDPAGGRIAYSTTVAGAPTVKILNLADGTSTALTGGAKPAWQPLQKNVITRVYPTGTGTMDAAASRWTFDTLGAPHVAGLLPAKSVVLTDKGNGTYAVPAITLAAEKQAPVLMTSAASLDSSATAEIKRILPKGGTVYLNGSTTRLSAKVASQVTALGYTALRMDAPDLAGLTVRDAKQITQTPSWIFVADGAEYHDSIAAATAAGALGYHGLGVVLVSNGKTISTAVRNYLNTLNPATTNLVTVGFNATVAMENTAFTKVWSFSTVGGATHEDVAVNLAKLWWAAPAEAQIQNNTSWQNAVTGGAVTAAYGPMLWSATDTLSAPTEYYLGQRAASIQFVQTYGGNQFYATANLTAVRNAVAANSAWTDTIFAPNGDEPAAPAAKSAVKSLLAPAASSAAGRPRTSEGSVLGRHLPAPDRHTAG